MCFRYEDQLIESGLSPGDEPWVEADLPYVGEDPGGYTDPTGTPGQQAGAVAGQEHKCAFWSASHAGI